MHNHDHPEDQPGQSAQRACFISRRGSPDSRQMHCGVKDPAGRACARIPAPGEQKLRHAAASRSSRLLEAESSRQPSFLPSIGSGSLPRLMDWTYQAPRAPRGCRLPRKHPGEAQSGFLWASSLIPYGQPGGPKLTDRVTITTLSTLLNLKASCSPPKIRLPI